MTSSPFSSVDRRFLVKGSILRRVRFILVDMHRAGLELALETECAHFGRAGMIEAATPRTLRLFFRCWGCSLQARRREWWSLSRNLLARSMPAFLASDAIWSAYVGVEMSTVAPQSTMALSRWAVDCAPPEIASAPIFRAASQPAPKADEGSERKGKIDAIAGVDTGRFKDNFPALRPPIPRFLGIEPINRFARGAGSLMHPN